MGVYHLIYSENTSIVSTFWGYECQNSLLSLLFLCNLHQTAPVVHNQIKQGKATHFHCQWKPRISLEGSPYQIECTRKVVRIGYMPPCYNSWKLKNIHTFLIAFRSELLSRRNDLLKKNHPILKDTKLVIEQTKAIGKCTGCDYEGTLNPAELPEYHFNIPSLDCPKCNKKLDIIQGRDLIIKNIEIEKWDIIAF